MVMNSRENQSLNKDGAEQASSQEQTTPQVEKFEEGSEHETELALDSIESTSNKSADEALDTAKMIETSPLPRTRKEQLRDKLGRNLKRLFRVLSFASVLTGAAGMADYGLTRYRVEETKSGDAGGIIYNHQDKETTHIINTLAGKESLNESDKRDILIDYITEQLQMLHEREQYLEIGQSDVNKMPLDDLTELAKEFKFVTGGLNKLITDPGPEAFDPELYNALWKLEQECGSPKIKFRLASKKNIFKLYNPNSSFYNPYTNTAFIDIGANAETIDNYIAELSHGKQFAENPITSNLLAVKGIVKSAKGALAGEGPGAVRSGADDRIHRSYEQLYQEPGSLEYDAHKVIQPKLLAEMDSLTPSRTAGAERAELQREQINSRVRTEINKIDAEEQKKLDEALRSYFQKKIIAKDSAESDKLLEQYRNQVLRIHDEFQKKKDTAAKGFGLR